MPLTTRSAPSEIRLSGLCFIREWTRLTLTFQLHQSLALPAPPTDRSCSFTSTPLPWDKEVFGHSTHVAAIIAGEADPAAMPQAAIQAAADRGDDSYHPRSSAGHQRDGPSLKAADPQGSRRQRRCRRNGPHSGYQVHPTVQRLRPAPGRTWRQYLSELSRSRQLVFLRADAALYRDQPPRQIWRGCGRGGGKLWPYHYLPQPLSTSEAVRRRPFRTPLGDLTQLGAIGYDDEVDSQAVRGPRLGRAGDGYQRSSSANHARRPLRDVAAEDIENQIDPADIFQGVVIEVDELLRAEVDSRLTAASAPGADDVRASLTCELGRHRTDYAGRTVHEDALPRTKAAMLEQPLPRGQARHHEGRAHREVNVARQRREVACLDGYILRQRAVASPVREAEHPLSHRQPRRSIAEGR
jgi:hypothetical protein